MRGVKMPSAHYYRSQAERCRKLASDDSQPGSAAQLHRMASDYDQLARIFDASEGTGALLVSVVDKRQRS